MVLAPSLLSFRQSSAQNVRHALIAFVLVAGLAALPAAAETVVFRGGLVFDGTGAPGRIADVWISGGEIVAVGTQPDVAAGREIDATGRILAPGFIDTHAHGDPLKTPVFENFLRMGVTSICLGQDGSSPFADDLESWRQAVEEEGIAVNVVPFVGHGTVRRRSGVGIESDPDPDAIERMVGLVEGALTAGAFGLTTGLEYQPGSFARMEELVAVARPVAAVDGLVMSHVRNEDQGEVLLAVDELLAQGQQSGARVHVSHIKTVFGRGPAPAEELLERLEAARGRGVQVTADVYPYTASFTGIGIVFPDWAKPPHVYEEVVRDRREDLATFLRERITMRNGPEATLIGTGRWSGMTLAEIAAETGEPFEEVLIGMGPGGASGAYFVMDEATMERFLVDPHVMVCSDGSPTMLHPRGYGSFPRVIARYARERELLSLEETLFKMTGLPAATVALDRAGPGAPPRGRIQPGWAADLVVFKLDQIADRATFENPHTFAEGISHVMVNGRFVVDEGALTSERPGRVLRLPKP